MTLGRVSTVDALVVALREQVFDGRVQAGEALRETALCEEFGVSRHSLRLALSVLSHEGLLRHEPNRGVFVRRLSTAEIHDLYRMRRLLELDALKTVCGDREALAPARDAAQQMVDMSNRHVPWTATREADLAFHSALVDALGSHHMSSTYGSLLVELRLCFLIEGFANKDQELLAKEHFAMLETMESGNLSQATQQLSEHLKNSEGEAVGALEKMMSEEAAPSRA